MKKFITVIFLVIVIQRIGYTQDINGESGWHKDILHNLDTTTQDTSRVLLIGELANYYKFYLPDSALFYGYKALALARQIKFPKFFTTKPTGQGTGLGLSLAYDIIKAHGGELKVETKEGEGSEFFIQISTQK